MNKPASLQPGLIGQRWFSIAARLVDRFQMVGHLKCALSAVYKIFWRPKRGFKRTPLEPPRTPLTYGPVYSGQCYSNLDHLIVMLGLILIWATSFWSNLILIWITLLYSGQSYSNLDHLIVMLSLILIWATSFWSEPPLSDMSTSFWSALHSMGIANGRDGWVWPNHFFTD